MIIPKKIKIGAIWWKVKFVPAGDISDTEMVSGNQSNQIQTIKLDKDASREMQEETFIHEILHCMNDQLGHQEVEWLAQSLYQVFTENKMLK